MIQENWGNYLDKVFLENMNRIAVVDVSKNARYSYRDIMRQTKSIQRALVASGIEKGMHVAMIFPSSADWIECFLALIQLGAVPVCLNNNDSDGELRAAILSSDSRLVITDETTHVKIRLHEEELELIRVIIVDRNGYCSEGLHCSFETFLEEGRSTDDDVIEIMKNNVCYDDILAIQYTSGTTGSPKAVMSVHYRVLSNVILYRDIFRYNKEDKILCSLPMYHMMGCFFTCLLAFATGCSLVIMDKFKTSYAIRTLIEEECTSFHGVPTIYKLILSKIGDSQFTHLKKCMVAGSYCEPEVLKGIRSKMGIEHIFPAYGQTEGNGYTQIRMGDPIEKIFGTVGRPVEGVKIKIVNKDLEEVGVNEEGEVLVQTDYKMAGYYKDQESTNEVIVEDWIHTGDLGKVDEEGYLIITGRSKDIIVRGGENISPVEIELSLKEMCHIKDVVVVGVPDEVMGQEIAACIIIEEEAKRIGEERFKEELASYMKRHLAKHKWPKYIKCVEHFPLTGSGKIQKAKIVGEVFV